jgi:hypothetical protein
MGKMSEIHADIHSPTGYYGYPETIGSSYDLPMTINIPEEVHILTSYCEATSKLENIYAYLDYEVACQAKTLAEKLQDDNQGETYIKEYFIETIPIRS